MTSSVVGWHRRIAAQFPRLLRRSLQGPSVTRSSAVFPVLARFFAVTTGKSASYQHKSSVFPCWLIASVCFPCFSRASVIVIILILGVLFVEMGAGASVSQEEVQKYPQYSILGGDKKWNEIKGEDGTLDLTAAGIEDPYLKYGGAYLGDPKDGPDFKYVTFNELPKFTPQHKSGMAKHLTPELFEKLKDVKSSKGYTLSNVIMTGVVTPHLGVGATAGDEECWELFKDLFYPIIKDWHGYDAYTQKHPVDLDPSKLVFTDEQRATFNEYVASTRIRAARNISGYSLPPGATDEDRAASESVLKQTFAGLTGELEGTYYELGALTPEQTSFLLDRGFLFQIPTARNLLTGAGAARSWPNNRGIFHNATQTALCWVNEEDHCRIISMETGK
jgi:hypothetical protein